MPAKTCTSCVAACCKGPILMQLSNPEYKAMSGAGNTFVTIAKPADHDREQVPYPYAMQINEQRGTQQFLFEKGRETEPLAAGLGRYMLIGACKNLVIPPFGIELCGVYETRPEVCRDFEVGGQTCELLRIVHQVDPA
jgi:Fe-S-cluster containining protein